MTKIGRFSLVVVELMAVTAVMVVVGIQYDWFSAKAGILIGAVIIKKIPSCSLGSKHARSFLDNTSSFRRACHIA
jgi:hypothetical protein